jgi:hypothetical protein
MSPFPTHRSFADPHGKIMVFRENPTKIPGKKSAKVYQFLYSSLMIATAGGTVNLHDSQVMLEQ